MKLENGEKEFLVSVYKLISNAKRIKDESNKEFLVLPIDVAEKIAEGLLMVSNRIDD